MGGRGFGVWVFSKNKDWFKPINFFSIATKNKVIYDRYYGDNSNIQIIIDTRTDTNSEFNYQKLTEHQLFFNSYASKSEEKSSSKKILAPQQNLPLKSSFLGTEQKSPLTLKVKSISFSLFMVQGKMMWISFRKFLMTTLLMTLTWSPM